MSKYSRVKKYEDLRNNIEIEKNELGELAKQNPSAVLFDHKHEPKTNVSNVQTEAFEDASGPSTDYIDEYIKEAKVYNIERGLRNAENTQLNILNQMNIIPQRTNEYFEELVEQPQTFEEISTKVLEMTGELNVIDDTEEELNLDDVIKNLSSQEDEIEKSFVESAFLDSMEPQFVESTMNLEESKILLEETKQLRLVVEEYGEEVEELHDDVKKTHSILNWILGFIIFGFFLLIIVVVLWIVRMGGI